MCSDFEPKTIAKKASVIGLNGEVYHPVTVMGPIVGGEVRIYGNPKVVPGGSSTLRFQAVYAKTGEKVL